MPDRPFASRALSDLLRNQQLQQASDIRYAASGVSVSAPAVLNSTVGGVGSVVPVDGSGRVNYVRYMRNNNLIVGWFRFYFGAGSTFGNGAWTFTLPVPAAVQDADIRPIGTYEAFDASSSLTNVGVVVLNAVGGAIAFRYLVESVAGTPTGFYSTVSNLVPWTWANDDYLQGYFTYEADSGYAP